MAQFAIRGFPTYPLDASQLPTPVDTPGSWVPTKDFRGKKSFGAFECDRCRKTWLSAHAQARFKQACVRCKHFYTASFMWVNEPSNGRRVKREYEDQKKPHLKDLCEACRAGKCDQQQSYYSDDVDDELATLEFDRLTL